MIQILINIICLLTGIKVYYGQPYQRLYIDQEEPVMLAVINLNSYLLRRTEIALSMFLKIKKGFAMAAFIDICKRVKCIHYDSNGLF